MAFAKIFELQDGNQLLMTKETDDIKGPESALLCFRIREEKKAVTRTLILAYATEEMRDDVFERLTTEMAQELYLTNVQKMAK